MVLRSGFAIVCLLEILVGTKSLVLRLTGVWAIPGDCRTDAEVCRALEYGLTEVSGHAHRECIGVRRDASKPLRRLPNSRECPSRVFAKRRNGHESAQGEVRGTEHALGQLLEPVGRHSPSVRVTGEVQLEKGLDGQLGGLKGVD